MEESAESFIGGQQTQEKSADLYFYITFQNSRSQLVYYRIYQASQTQQNDQQTSQREKKHLGSNYSKMLA